MDYILKLTGGRGTVGPLSADLVAAHHARGTTAAAVAVAAIADLAKAAESVALQCVLAAGVERDRWHDGRPVQHAIEAIQCDLLRDIFGNPFRPVMISPAVLAWHDGLVVRLAQAAYEERHLPAGTLDSGRLAVLADALEEASCTSEDILGHLRGPGPHMRGCWPVDLVLGKE
jgi:hypothetical protein